MPDTPSSDWEALLPYDLEGTNLGEYKQLKPEYQDWSVVAEMCRALAIQIW